MRAKIIIAEIEGPAAAKLVASLLEYGASFQVEHLPEKAAKPKRPLLRDQIMAAHAVSVIADGKPAKNEKRPSGREIVARIFEDGASHSTPVVMEAFRKANLQPKAARSRLTEAVARGELAKLANGIYRKAGNSAEPKKEEL